MKNLSNLMKQAQKMQEKLLEAQNKVGEMVVDGSSGGGMVVIKLNGKYEIIDLVIDPKLANPDDAAMISDLVIAAYNDAKKKIEQSASQNMESLTSMLPPGFKLPF